LDRAAGTATDEAVKELAEVLGWWMSVKNFGHKLLCILLEK
jgi:hypothetical protein